MADLERPLKVHCARCGKKIKVRAIGRVPKYCTTRSCRQMAYTKRQRAKEPTVQTVSAVRTMTESQHRQLTWTLLQDAGIVPVDAPLPEPRQE